MNAGPIEHFDKWDIHKEGTQPAIRRVTDALDVERIAIRQALGYGAPHFPLANHYSKDGEPWMYARDAHDQLTDSGDWSERLILFDRTSSYHELTSALFREAGVVPVSVMELDNVEAAKKMVQLGLGVALLPRMALAAELRSRSLRPVRLIGAQPARRPIVALRRKDAGAPIGPVAGFLETLREAKL